MHVPPRAFLQSAVWLLPCLLAACAVTPEPLAERPSPVPGSYVRAATPTATVDAPGWRDYFADPELRALIGQALAHNRDLHAAIARVEEARALYGIQRADRFPSVSAQAEGGRSRTPGDLSPGGQAQVGSRYEVALGLASWEIDFWGRVRSLETAALENYLASYAAQRAFAVSLVAEVAHGWLLQREYDQRIALAQRSVSTRQESLRIYRRRVEVGSSSRFELAQVEALLVQAQALLVQLEQQRESNGHALALLVGSPVELTPRTDVLDGRVALYPIEPGLPSDLLTNRPDIAAAEHRLRSAQANVAAARAAFFPRIGLTGALGIASDELDGLFESGNRAWRFLPTLSLPIFDAGRLRNNRDLAETRSVLAVFDYEKTIQAAFRDVSDALGARHWLTRQLEVRQQAERTQRERARLAQLRYDAGATGYLDVLDAQRELLQAEQDLVSTQRQLLASQVSLYAALGGGPLGRGQPLPRPDAPVSSQD